MPLMFYSKIYVFYTPFSVFCNKKNLICFQISFFLLFIYFFWIPNFGCWLREWDFQIEISNHYSKTVFFPFFIQHSSLGFHIKETSFFLYRGALNKLFIGKHANHPLQIDVVAYGQYLETLINISMQIMSLTFEKHCIWNVHFLLCF